MRLPESTQLHSIDNVWWQKLSFRSIWEKTGYRPREILLKWPVKTSLVPALHRIPFEGREISEF